MVHFLIRKWYTFKLVYTQMSNQLQIESYRISMRKLRTFYGKVTEFLNDDKIAYLQGLGVIVIINVY